MNKQKLSLSLLLLGIVLAVASWVWPRDWSGYNEEQAVALQNASVAYHNSLHIGEHAHPHPNAHDGDHMHDVPEARENYKQALDEAKQARAFQSQLPQYLLWLGTIIGCLGGIGYFVTKNEQ